MRTFIEVASSGSFAGAAERLYVTQSAVSLRIQRLEDVLGRPLFIRSKAGAELTPAGAEFERFALGHIKLWEEGKQQVAIPDGFRKSLIIGADFSLWPRMGFRWIDAIRAEMPELSIRAEFGAPERLTRFLIEGIVQTALMYTPQLRPGLRVEKVMDDELIMVASWPDPQLDTLQGRYLFIDWGPEFVQAHAIDLAGLTNPGLSFALGALSVDFLLKREFAAYLPARFVGSLIDRGRLYPVAEAPRFPFPVYNVWREDLDEEIAAIMRNALHRVSTGLIVQQNRLMGELAELQEDDEIGILGEGAAEQFDNLR